jgi:hypothetical protein
MADNQSIVAGLFTTPEQYQQAQSNAALQRGIELAQLDPLQRASAQMYQGGYLAGNALGGALGGQDPQLQLQSARQSILKGVDQTSATSLRDAAQKLADMGDLQGANALAQQSVAIQAKIDEKQAQRASMEAIAAGRNETALQIADLRAQMSQATNALQAQLIQAKIDALQAKQDKSQVADDKAATRIGQNSMFDTLISEGDKLSEVIDKNKDAFSLGGRASTAIKSVINPSAPSVQAVSDVDSYMKKARNAYLLAAKGTQTEGDAQRAWDEFAGKLDFSSAEGAKRSVERIKAELSSQKQANEAYLKSRGISTGPALGTKDNPIKLK